MRPNVRPDADDAGLGGSAEPVAPPPDVKALLHEARRAASAVYLAAEAGPAASISGLITRLADALEAALARAPQDDNDASRAVRDAARELLGHISAAMVDVAVYPVEFTEAINKLKTALGAYDSPVRAPQGDPPPSGDKRERGLYRKFIVERVDGKSAPGQKHDGCEYFVLDLTHDKRALPALRAYAGAADLDGDHALATDLYAKVGLPDRTDSAVELSASRGLAPRTGRMDLHDELDRRFPVYDDFAAFVWVPAPQGDAPPPKGDL